MMEVGFAWRSIGEEERATAPHMASKIQGKGTFSSEKIANEPPIDGGIFSWYFLAECMKNTKE